MKVSILTWPTAAMFWKMFLTVIYRQEREYFVPRCCLKNGAFCAVANLLKAKFQPMFRASVCWQTKCITSPQEVMAQHASEKFQKPCIIWVFSKPQWQVWIWIKIRANWNFTKYCSVLHEILAKHLNFG